MFNPLPVLTNLSYVLDKEVDWQNHLISLNNVSLVEEEPDMQEVKALGASLRDMMGQIKSAAADAQSAFQTEAQRALVNSGKVKSAAADLKSANLEIESFLGEAGSNFPPSETSTPPTPTGSPPVTPQAVEFQGSTLVIKK